MSQLKSQLSAHLREVKAGETILILDRNKPVARLERIEPQAPGTDALTRLVRDGLVKPPSRPIAMERLRLPARKAKQSVLAALLEDRSEGR